MTLYYLPEQRIEASDIPMGHSLLPYLVLLHMSMMIIISVVLFIATIFWQSENSGSVTSISTYFMSSLIKVGFLMDRLALNFSFHSFINLEDVHCIGKSKSKEHLGLLHVKSQ